MNCLDGASLTYVHTFCSSLLGGAGLEQCRAEVQSRCGIDVLSWFRQAPGESQAGRATVERCVTAGFQQQPGWVEQLETVVREKEGGRTGRVHSHSKGRCKAIKKHDNKKLQQFCFNIRFLLDGPLTLHQGGGGSGRRGWRAGWWCWPVWWAWQCRAGGTTGTTPSSGRSGQRRRRSCSVSWQSSQPAPTFVVQNIR